MLQMGIFVSKFSGGTPLQTVFSFFHHDPLPCLIKINVFFWIGKIPQIIPSQARKHLQTKSWSDWAQIWCVNSVWDPGLINFWTHALWCIPAVFWPPIGLWLTESLPGLINTLGLWQNGRHFPDDIFKYIFLNENIWISRFHWSLFPRVQLTILQHFLR